MRKNNFNNRGFTLMELIITISIIAVLASVAVPSYKAIINNAENSLALANINIIRKFVSMAMIGDDFSNEEKYTYVQNKPSVDQDINYLSRYIEVEWEELGESTDDDDNSNYINILNPESYRSGIVN